ncbi:LytR/AlgR family response regulator transcription factor [Vallitalea guaymasensis]|uniref:LytR/AlgR family response regulator transcription factor n=1 Tax=Vallitalea guaymasensis TaxID=1185412 RepID=UPI000DE1A7F4|nr:LytTR family DNA-binding domain-containing protein [Vallitalea guaymasensis]
MIRVIIVDDEQPAIDELNYILSKYDEIDVVGKFDDPIQALEFIKKHQVEVVFLDISMPEMDGFMFAQQIINLNLNINVVFATAYNEYAIKAFEINAIDYILKPLDDERLEMTVLKIKDRVDNNLKQDSRNIEKVIESHKIKLKKFPVWKGERIILMDPDEILFCYVENSETYIVTENESYYTADTLCKLEKTFEDHSFFRCHRSYLINLEKIEEIIPWFNKTYAVKFKNCEKEIPISRRQSCQFKKMFDL